MEIVTGLPAIGLARGTFPHAAAFAPVQVKHDDLDLSSLRGMLDLQNRLEQAIADACWHGQKPNYCDI